MEANCGPQCAKAAEKAALITSGVAYHLPAFNSNLYWSSKVSSMAALCGKWFVQVTIVYWKSALFIRLLHWLYGTVQV